jgi:acyl-CoA thioester hydrolase
MADVDAAGLIYFAAPLPWAERLFNDWMADLGYGTSRLFASDLAYPVVDTHVEYRTALRLDDMMRLELTVSRMGTSSFTVRTRAIRESDAALCVQVELVHVFVTGLSSEPRPARLPGWLTSCLRGERRPGDPPEGDLRAV